MFGTIPGLSAARYDGRRNLGHSHGIRRTTRVCKRQRRILYVCRYGSTQSTPAPVRYPAGTQGARVDTHRRPAEIRPVHAADTDNSAGIRTGSRKRGRSMKQPYTRPEIPPVKEPEQGHICATCTHCEYDRFHPGKNGLCKFTGNMIRFLAINHCRNYDPRYHRDMCKTTSYSNDKKE